MATLPYFAFSPTALMSAAGFLQRSHEPSTTPSEDWHTAVVDVVIPARNEAPHIVLCLASLQRQTLKPHRIRLIDDGSTDATVKAAEAFGRMHGMNLEVVRRARAIGKTPTLKRESRELDGDVLFVLDADTVLESDDYLARTVEALYRSPTNASACGFVLPQGVRDRRHWLREPAVELFASQHPWHRMEMPDGWHTLSRGVTNAYRGVLYAFLQRFVYRGNNRLFGSMTNPVGCAVAYRRHFLRTLFDTYEPHLGDDLTNSEDIFIGFAMLDANCRNVQVNDAMARTVEPEFQNLLKQVYLWSSAFLQSCYYFDPLLRRSYARKGHGTPGAPHRGWRDRLFGAHDRLPRAAMFRTAFAGGPPGAFGGLPTPMFLKPATPAQPTPVLAGAGAPAAATPPAQPRTGWMPLMAAIEKVSFPTILIIMAILGLWYALMWTVIAETLLGAVLLAMVMPGHRVQSAVKAIAVAPIRYGLMVSEVVTIARFATDLWIRKDRRWRK